MTKKTITELTTILLLVAIAALGVSPVLAQDDDGNGVTAAELYDNGIHTAGWQKNATLERTKGIFRLKNLNFLYDQYVNRQLPTRNIPFATGFIKNLIASVFFQTLLQQEEFEALENGDYISLLDERIENMDFGMPEFAEKGTVPRISAKRAEVRYDDGSIIKFTDSQQNDLFNNRRQKFSIIPKEDLEEEISTPDNYERISQIGVAGDIVFNGNFRMMHPSDRDYNNRLDYYMEFIYEGYIKETRENWNEPGNKMKKGNGSIRRYTKTLIHYMIRDTAPNGDITWFKKWEEYLGYLNDITNYDMVFKYVNTEEDAWADWEKNGRPASIAINVFDTDDRVYTEFGADYEAGHIWATRTSIGIEDFTRDASTYYGMHGYYKDMFLYAVYIEWFRSHTGLTGFQSSDIFIWITDFIADKNQTQKPGALELYTEEKVSIAWVMGRLGKATVYRANGRWVDNDSRVDLDKLAASLEKWYNSNVEGTEGESEGSSSRYSTHRTSDVKALESGITPAELFRQKALRIERSAKSIDQLKQSILLRNHARHALQAVATIF
jgi:hypothetical protein